MPNNMDETIGATPEQTMKERCVTITLDRYNDLIKSEETLRALEAAGVDNWQGFDEAMKLIT